MIDVTDDFLIWMCLPNGLDHFPDDIGSRHAQLKLDFLDHFWFSGSPDRRPRIREWGEMRGSGYTEAYTDVGTDFSSSG